MLFCVTARHSPLPRKRLIIEAENADEALDLFLEANKDSAFRRKKSGPILLGHIQRWESEGGPVTVDIEEAADGCRADYPEPKPVMRSGGPPRPEGVGRHLGQVGRRPGRAEPETSAPVRRLSRREANQEKQLAVRAEGVQAEGDRPADRPGDEDRKQQAEQAEKPKRSYKKRATRAEQFDQADQAEPDGGRDTGEPADDRQGGEEESLPEGLLPLE